MTGECVPGGGRIDEAGCSAGKCGRTSAKMPEAIEDNNEALSRSDFDPEQCGPKTLAVSIECKRPRYRLVVGTVEHEIQGA